MRGWDFESPPQSIFLYNYGLRIGTNSLRVEKAREKEVEKREARVGKKITIKGCPPRFASLFGDVGAEGTHANL